MENYSKSSRSSPPAVFFQKGVYPAAKSIREFGFLFSVFCCIRSESCILPLYGKIWVRENPQSDIIQAMYFLRNTSGRLLLEFLWGTASGKMVKQQKSNGEHFQMFQKHSPSGVLLKRCLSFLKNTSGGILLGFLKNRYIVRRGLLLLLSS